MAFALRPEGKAQEILDKYWDDGVPVDVHAIARLAGTQVIEEPLSGFSGSFFCENGMPTIRVNSSESILRRRFTVAHELGHYVLRHEGGYRDGPDTFSVGAVDRKERDANLFASELLMPHDGVRYLLIGREIGGVTELANHMQVSEVAMQYRLKKLGYIS